MAIQTQGATLHIMTTGERVRSTVHRADAYSKAEAWASARYDLPNEVVFCFEDGSTATFKKVYELAHPMA